MARMVGISIFYSAASPSRAVTMINLSHISSRRPPFAYPGSQLRMNNIQLADDNRSVLTQWLDSGACVVACLCAAWCDTCGAFKHKFDDMATLHPEERFVWIDIEDQAGLVGDLDIENFPTLLIQRNDVVAFFGTVLPDLWQTDRLLRAQLNKSAEELVRDANSTVEKIDWQQRCNLRTRLQELPDD